MENTQKIIPPIFRMKNFSHFVVPMVDGRTESTNSDTSSALNSSIVNNGNNGSALENNVVLSTGRQQQHSERARYFDTETCDASKVCLDKKPNKPNPIAINTTTGVNAGGVDADFDNQLVGSNCCLQSETLAGVVENQNEKIANYHRNDFGNVINVFDTNCNTDDVCHRHEDATIFCMDNLTTRLSKEKTNNNNDDDNDDQDDRLLLQSTTKQQRQLLQNDATGNSADKQYNQYLPVPIGPNAVNNASVSTANLIWSGDDLCCCLTPSPTVNNRNHLDNSKDDNKMSKNRYCPDHSATKNNNNNKDNQMKKKKLIDQEAENEANVIDSAIISSSILSSSLPASSRVEKVVVLNGEDPPPAPASFNTISVGSFDHIDRSMIVCKYGDVDQLTESINNNNRLRQISQSISTGSKKQQKQLQPKESAKVCKPLQPEPVTDDHHYSSKLIVTKLSSSDLHQSPVTVNAETNTSTKTNTENRICLKSGDNIMRADSHLCNFCDHQPQTMSNCANGINVISAAAVSAAVTADAAEQTQHQDTICCDDNQCCCCYHHQYSAGLNVNRLIDETCHSCHRTQPPKPTSSKPCFNLIHTASQQSSQPPSLQPQTTSGQSKSPPRQYLEPLNPLGPLEFMEKYRDRNSSQRPLVSCSSSEINSRSKHNNRCNSTATDQCSELGSSSWFCSTASSITTSTKSDLSLSEEFGESTTPELLYSDHCNRNLPTAMTSSKSCKADVNGNENCDKDGPLPERGQWSGQLDFIFSCISYAVGLGNVWRFPYLCYENGGGAFLVPYLICVVLLGIPLFLMEVSLGQYLQSGGVAVWNRIPLMKGVGFASMVMIGLCNTYYIVIIAWTLYYLFRTMESPLPWSHCGNPWNTDACHQSYGNITGGEHTISPAQEFWERKVLNISDDLSNVGSIQWPLLITLVVGWILVYGVIYRGIHQSGKIIWFTAMFPYVLLVILFGFGISLSGASDGILFYITPKWHKLTEAKIWVAAGTQLLFTYGIGIGTNVALGSYNKFNHNFYRDSIIACMLSSATSLFSGFVIFSVLGHMATSMNTTVAEVARSGPGLAFIVYPEAVSKLPIPNLWAILFFVMLLVLGIDSQFCTVESFITGIVDEYPRLLRPRRKMFTFLVICVHCLLGISMITSGGMYVFQLMDNFSASGISLLIVVLMEVIGFAWIYGGERIYQNMIEMLGFKPNRILYYVWVYVSPSCLFAILLFSIFQNKPPEYAGKPFPWYGELFGWVISMASILCIPVYVVYYLLFKTDRKISLKERFMESLSADSDKIGHNNNNNNNNNNNDNNNVNEKSLKFDIEQNGQSLSLPPSPPPLYSDSVTSHPNPSANKLTRNHRQQSEVSSCSESTLSTSVTDRSSMA